MHRTVSSIGGFAARRSGGGGGGGGGGGAVRWAAAAGRMGKQRGFHASLRRDIVKPFLLADIGEGIKEVQIIQWFVQPGARVEQFDKICEVQSDKASVDITSRFDGVIKKLHYEADAMAQVGKPLLDIDITGDINPSDEKLLDDSSGSSEGSASSAPSSQSTASSSSSSNTASSTDQSTTSGSPPSSSSGPPPSRKAAPSSSASSANLATPAVRGLLKEKNLDISDIQGTGKDGRVLKEDVHAHVAAQKSGGGRSSEAAASSGASSTAGAAPAFSRPAIAAGAQQETPQSLTPVQNAMFKSMTKSLAIPHFLCGDEVDLTALTVLRQQLNSTLGSNEPKLSALAFTMKALSLTLDAYPILNARLDTSNGAPKLVHRSQHNIGVAMDTPGGLIVPNIKSVNALSVGEIARELVRLQQLAAANKLTSADLRGGTISVSNIGSIGGTYATPLLVEGELCILATGRAKRVPRFDATGAVKARDIAAFSWSADHRVVDGATVARAAGHVRALLEQPGRMVVALR